MRSLDVIDKQICIIESEISRLKGEKKKWENRNDEHMVGITLHRLSFQDGVLKALKWVLEKND